MASSHSLSAQPAGSGAPSSGQHGKALASPSDLDRNGLADFSSLFLCFKKRPITDCSDKTMTGSVA